jgi:prophage antirepressor-like protein
MIDTGSKNGFIKNSLLVLKNEELNAEKFENWIKNQLLQNIKEKSVIILDNAPIHSK